MNKKSFQPINTRGSIIVIRQLIDCRSVTAKDDTHVFALAAGADALEEQGGNDTIIRMLRYHETHKDANIFPDGHTKAALEAAEKALLRKLAEEKKEAGGNAAN